MRFGVRAEQLSAETAFDETAKLENDGIPFINFAHGDPDQATPQPIKDATCDALARGMTRYTVAAGMIELRRAIAEHVRRTRGVTAEWEEVLVLPGANPAVLLALLVVIDPGDEVICPNPGYPLFPAAIRAAGGVPVSLPLRAERGHTFDPDEFKALITPRTRAVIVNSPNNPTGSVLGREHVAAVARVAEERDLWILSDEVYADFVYEGQFMSPISFPEGLGRTLLIDSLSKTFAMTGWRLGYVVGPRALIERLTTLFTVVDFSVNTFIQYGGAEAIRRHREVAGHMRELYRDRRDRVVAGLNAIPGISCSAPPGSIYVFPDVTEACRLTGVPDAPALQRLALDRCRVALLARDWFGPRNAGETGEFVRLSLTLPTPDIELGLERLATLVS